MPPDPALVLETKAWLGKAKQDLVAAQHDTTAVPPLLEDISFHSQQAVEKTLKAFLTYHGQTFRKTHNLVELGEACVAIDSQLDHVLRMAAPLTEFAWRFRYPGDPESPPREEALAGLELARQIFE